MCVALLVIYIDMDAGFLTPFLKLFWENFKKASKPALHADFRIRNILKITLKTQRSPLPIRVRTRIIKEAAPKKLLPYHVYLSFLSVVESGSFRCTLIRDILIISRHGFRALLVLLDALLTTVEMD